MSKGSRRRGLVVAVLAAATALAATAGTAAANTYKADLLTDLVVVPVCDPEPDDDPCQLREAIKAAANNPGADTVELVPGTYQQGPLAGEDGVDDNDGGDWDYGAYGVGGALTIIGAGQGVSNIDRSGGGDRLFEFAGTDSVTLSQLTLLNGWTYVAALDGANGGAIEAKIGAPGSLTLNDVTIIAGWASGDGGGIASTSNQLVLNRVTIRESIAGSGDMGGATTGSGGAVAIEDSVAGVSAQINSSTLNGNRATDETPGVFPTADGGAIFAIGNGIAPDPVVTVTNSTLDSNLAHGYGGGIANADGATVNLANATVTRNRANADNDPNTDAGGAERGGGLQNGVSLINLTNSLIALNTVGTGGLNPDCNSSVGLTSGGGNVLSNATGCAGYPAGVGDTVAPSPLLGMLAANGGPTRTVALLAGSPAIDHASGCPGTDQRGVSRPQGPACDSGAFEVEVAASVPPPASTAAPPATPAAPAKRTCKKKKKRKRRALAAKKKKKKCKR